MTSSALAAAWSGVESASRPRSRSNSPIASTFQVAGSGVKAVLNFSPGTLLVPDGIKMKSVDLTVSLESLSFFLAQGDAPS